MYGIKNTLQIINTIKCIGFGNIIGAVFLIMKNIKIKNKTIIILRDIILNLIFVFLGYFFIIDINCGIFRFFLMTAEITGYLLFTKEIMHFIKKEIEN